MPNYNDAQGVADLLSQFDFNIISEGPGDFSPSHRKYTCEFSKPGKMCIRDRSMSQLESKYDKKAQTIVDCCDSTLFLGGKSNSTNKEIAEKMCIRDSL